MESAQHGASATHSNAQLSRAASAHACERDCQNHANSESPVNAISTAEQPAIGDAATGAAGGDTHAHGKEADELSFSYDGSEMDDLDEDDDDAESRKPQPAKVC